MKYAILALALALVSAPAFARSNAALEKTDRSLKSCLAKNEDNAGRNNCTSDAYDAVTKILQHSYEGIVALLKVHTGQAYEERNNAESLRRLIESERAWIKFRDADCALQSAREINSSGEGLLYFTCLYDTVVKRVHSIENLYYN